MGPAAVAFVGSTPRARFQEGRWRPQAAASRVGRGSWSTSTRTGHTRLPTMVFWLDHRTSQQLRRKSSMYIGLGTLVLVIVVLVFVL